MVFREEGYIVKGEAKNQKTNDDVMGRLGFRLGSQRFWKILVRVMQS